MEGISDLKIIGLDGKRPPRIRAEPYIDLYFKLSHKAPKDWCSDFEHLVAHHGYKPRIDAEEGLFIEAWVRKATEVPALLAFLKTQIEACNQRYVERIEAARNAGNQSSDDGATSPEQAELDAVLAQLEF